MTPDLQPQREMLASSRDPPPLAHRQRLPTSSSAMVPRKVREMSADSKQTSSYCVLRCWHMIKIWLLKEDYCVFEYRRFKFPAYVLQRTLMSLCAEKLIYTGSSNSHYGSPSLTHALSLARSLTHSLVVFIRYWLKHTGLSNRSERVDVSVRQSWVQSSFGGTAT